MVQQLIVGLIVLASAAYLLRKFVFKPKHRPGGCCGCSQAGLCGREAKPPKQPDH